MVEANPDNQAGQPEDEADDLMLACITKMIAFMHDEECKEVA